MHGRATQLQMLLRTSIWTVKRSMPIIPEKNVNLELRQPFLIEHTTKNRPGSVVGGRGGRSTTFFVDSDQNNDCKSILVYTPVIVLKKTLHTPS